MYLFDILVLGPTTFRNGISSILENKETLKVSPVNKPETLGDAEVCFHLQVLHGCREMAACLMGQFGVQLNNVFDTQVRLFGVHCTTHLDFMLLWCAFERNFPTSACAKVADVMCFHSATGGFFPDRVSSLEQALSSHLQVPSSHLVSLRTKSQLTRVEHTLWSQMVSFI